MRYRFELVLALVLVTTVAAVWLWQNPGVYRAPPGPAEIERYLEAAARLPMADDEKREMLARLRTWLETDDGEPVYMLNVMRYFAELRRVPGAPEFAGTPEEANAHYEAQALPMVQDIGGQPVYGGTAGRNLMTYDPALDDWNRVLLVRYPSRRAFLDLVTRPDYAQIAPYKLMALRVVLTPTRAELRLPEYPWIAAVLALFVFLATGWLRAERRARSGSVPQG